jgi:hypothetical protein
MRERDHLRQRLEKKDKGWRKREQHNCLQENLRVERDYLSKTIADETRALKWIRRQKMHITESRRLELDNLHRELREKELNLAGLMEDYGETLPHGGECDDDLAPEVQWLCHKCVNKKYSLP